MQKILAGLEGVECRTDDILVFGDAHEQHDQQSEAVLKSIEDNGVTLNIEKCEFAMKTSVKMESKWIPRRSRQQSR